MRQGIWGGDGEAILRDTTMMDARLSVCPNPQNAHRQERPLMPAVDLSVPWVGLLLCDKITQTGPLKQAFVSHR